MDHSPRKVVTSLTLDPALLERLDAVADATDRSRSWTAGRAIEQFLNSEASVPNGDKSPSAPPNNHDSAQGCSSLGPWRATSNTKDNHMDSPQPQRVDPLRHTKDLHVAVLDKAAELARTRAEDEARRRDAVRRQNAEYFSGKQ